MPFATTHLVRDTCLCLHTQRAARAIARRFDEAFRPFGLKSGQFSLMMSLNRPEAPTLGAVASLRGMDRTTLTANLKPLERAGYVAVREDARDRRARRLLLTEGGLMLLAELAPVWERTHADLQARAGLADASRLRAELDAFR